MSRLSDIDFEDEKIPIPKEIYDYVMAHYEEWGNVPMNAENCHKIAEIIDRENNHVEQ